MRPRDILAANLKTLMNARGDRARFPDITQASRGKLTNGTLDRIRRADVAITVDKLEDLAEVFGLKPWQLLVEDLNPEALPRLADAAFIEQLRGLVQTADVSKSNANPDKSAHQLESLKGQEKMSPALKKVLDEGAGRNASGKAGRVQKPRTRRGA